MAKSSKQKSNNNISNSTTDRIVEKVRRTRKSVPRESPQRRSSVFRGVTRHRWTGRYEAHLWDKNCWNESQSKKGRQVYLGAYDDEEAAAHAYDLAALKYWGHDTILNFPLSTYENELKEMDGQSREEYIGSLRRKSSGFSRGVSKYRGVARHHHNGRWEARIGRVFGNKYLYLGTYATQEEAATAYDIAAIEYRGLNAITNFDLSNYIDMIRLLQTNSESTTNPSEKDEGTTLMQNPNQELEFINKCMDHSQESSSSIQTVPSTHSNGDATASSALGVLLQSTKFKEMLACNTQLSPSEIEPLEPEHPHSIFPDDIQTSFDIQDSSNFTVEHEDIFGNYDPFITPLLQFGLDA